MNNLHGVSVKTATYRTMTTSRQMTYMDPSDFDTRTSPGVLQPGTFGTDDTEGFSCVCQKASLCTDRWRTLRRRRAGSTRRTCRRGWGCWSRRTRCSRQRRSQKTTRPKDHAQLESTESHQSMKAKIKKSDKKCICQMTKRIIRGQSHCTMQPQHNSLKTTFRIRQQCLAEPDVDVDQHGVVRRRGIARAANTVMPSAHFTWNKMNVK